MRCPRTRRSRTSVAVGSLSLALPLAVGLAVPTGPSAVAKEPRLRGLEPVVKEVPVTVGRVMPGRAAVTAPQAVDGFGVVGASALLLVAVAVLIVGVVSDRGDRAELLAMVALFAYLVFVLVALTLTRYVGRR